MNLQKPTGETASAMRMPRAISALRKAWRAIVASESALSADAATEIRALVQEAKPHKLRLTIVEVKNLQFTDETCALNVVFHDSNTKTVGSGAKESALVHPTMGALYTKRTTIQQLERALQNADREADWVRARKIGTALLEVMQTEPVEDIESERINNPRIETGRLIRIDEDLATAISAESTRHLSGSQAGLAGMGHSTH